MRGSQDSPFTYDSFTRPHRKRRGKHRRGHVPTPSDLLARVKEDLEADRGWTHCCGEIFHEALRDVGSKPQKVLCLGLGSPCSSRDARAQLALLGYLCASSDIDAGDVSVYDPVFTDADRELFQTLGMRCLDHIQGAEYSLGCPTVLYMPHCDMKLYERVLRANWTAEGLPRMVFVANRFEDYVDNNAGSKLQGEAPCLVRAARWMASRALPTSDTFPTAFGSLSVQYVRHDHAQLAMPSQPLYAVNAQAEEIVYNTDQSSISTTSSTDRQDYVGRHSTAS